MINFPADVMAHLTEQIDWTETEILANTVEKKLGNATAYIIDLPSWWVYYYVADSDLTFMLVNSFGFKGFGETLPEAFDDLDRRLENRIAMCA